MHFYYLYTIYISTNALIFLDFFLDVRLLAYYFRLFGVDDFQLLHFRAVYYLCIIYTSPTNSQITVLKYYHIKRIKIFLLIF